MTLFDRISTFSQIEEVESGGDSAETEEKIIQCASCLCKNAINEIDAAIFGELSDRHDPSHRIKLNRCRECGSHSALNVDGKWYPIESILTTAEYGKQGIKRVDSYAERLTLFTLSQICYPEDDIFVLEQGADTSDLQAACPFLPPGPTEIANILWVDGQAVGFYTVKEKGSQLSDCPFEKYRMPVLDTIYVRKIMRRRGFAEQMLEDFIETYSDNDLGISDPISGNMLKVLEKILHKVQDIRDRIWACSYTGEEGYRSNIWFNIKLMNNRSK